MNVGGSEIRFCEGNRMFSVIVVAVEVIFQVATVIAGCIGLAIGELV